MHEQAGFNPAAKELPGAGVMPRRRIFILSPASCSGKRAAMLFNERAEFALATRLRTLSGASIAEVFSFLSGLYFRGKLSYATAFQRPPAGTEGIHVITPTDGLRTPDTRVTLADLERFAAVPIDAADPRYRDSLDCDARTLADAIGSECDVVLLGSVATEKYVGVLEPIFGRRLLFPVEFLGYGDMSRGAMLLKREASGEEFNYLPVSDPSRLGRRAKKGHVTSDAPLEAPPG